MFEHWHCHPREGGDPPDSRLRGDDAHLYLFYLLFFICYQRHDKKPPHTGYPKKRQKGITEKRRQMVKEQAAERSAHKHRRAIHQIEIRQTADPFFRADRFHHEIDHEKIETSPDRARKK